MLNDIKLSGKKILVTGAAGFIGSNIAEWLLNRDNHVIALDNFATGKKENINNLLSSPNFTFIEGDIRDQQVCLDACQKADFVLHQAALGSVPRSINDPVTSTEVNILGFVNMLFAAKETGIKRFVYAASSSTYGDSKSLPKLEENIGKPLSPYAISKYVNELHAANFADIYGIQTIGLRYFNVFGRRQDPNGAYAAVIPLFIKKLLNYESPLINGDGLHARDFTYIDNVIEANIRALMIENKDAVNQVYNVAYGEKTTLNELFDILVSLLKDYDPKIAAISPQYGPERPGDVKESLASIEKAENLLAYAPQYNLQSGLEKAIKWYIDYFKKEAY